MDCNQDQPQKPWKGKGIGKKTKIAVVPNNSETDKPTAPTENPNPPIGNEQDKLQKRWKGKGAGKTTRIAPLPKVYARDHAKNKPQYQWKEETKILVAKYKLHNYVDPSRSVSLCQQTKHPATTEAQPTTNRTSQGNNSPPTLTSRPNETVNQSLVRLVEQLIKITSKPSIIRPHKNVNTQPGPPIGETAANQNVASSEHLLPESFVLNIEQSHLYMRRVTRNNNINTLRTSHFSKDK